VTWLSNINEIRRCLGLLSVSDDNSRSMNIDDAFEIWTDLAIHTREQRNTVFLIGNGASASMASHVAADLTKNANVRTEVFTDLSLITAIANDVSFDEVFAVPLGRRIAQGDMLVAISSSGKSPNILRAAEIAEKHGGKVVTLSAMEGSNPLRKKGDINFYVGAQTYGMAETCHAALLHYWIDRIVSSNKTVKDEN
jgi:D-sedoheptulose 7-phosphate isomerase